MVLPPSGDVGNVDALFTAPENTGKSLQRNILLVVRTKKKKLSAATSPSDRENRGRRSEMEPNQKKRKKCFAILFMILSSKSELLKCSQDLS